MKFWTFLKKMILIALLFPKLFTPKTEVTKMCSRSCFRTLFSQASISSWYSFDQLWIEMISQPWSHLVVFQSEGSNLSISFSSLKLLHRFLDLNLFIQFSQFVNFSIYLLLRKCSAARSLIRYNSMSSAGSFVQVFI